MLEYSLILRLNLVPIKTFVLSYFSHVQLFAIIWTLARQALLPFTTLQLNSDLESHFLVRIHHCFFWEMFRWATIDPHRIYLCQNPPAMWKTWDLGSGRFPWRKDRLPIPVFLGFPCGSAGKESACNAGAPGSIAGLGRSPEEGKSYPLQYSGLENSMGCIVHGVAKSWTRLSDFHFHFFISI